MILSRIQTVFKFYRFDRTVLSLTQTELLENLNSQSNIYLVIISHSAQNLLYVIMLANRIMLVAVHRLCYVSSRFKSHNVNGSAQIVLSCAQVRLSRDWTRDWCTTRGPRWPTGGSPMTSGRSVRERRTSLRTRPRFSSTIDIWSVPTTDQQICNHLK